MAAASGPASSTRAATPTDVDREAHCSSSPELSRCGVRLEQYKTQQFRPLHYYRISISGLAHILVTSTARSLEALPQRLTRHGN
eukprot:9477782-Pyramimonas_sp.AAC.1